MRGNENANENENENENSARDRIIADFLKTH